MKYLQIAPDFVLPLDAVSQTFGILGIRGSGKTNTSVVMTEEMLQAGQQVVIIDPLDVWYGLRSSKDGKSNGFPIPVLGGDHSKIPIDANSGSIIAEFVVENRASVILSLRHLSVAAQRKVAAEFAERLYEIKGKDKYKTPLHLVIDEADEFVPQHIQRDQTKMFGAFDRIVRRGRASGIGVTLISQRAQAVNKDVLSQIETLIAMRVLHQLDRKALQAWVVAHDTEGKEERFLNSLASLKRGEAWVWSPSWLGCFQRIQVRERKTFDSSVTPKAGQVQVVPQKIAEVNYEKLEAALSATVEKAKANNPDELKKRIAELERQLKSKQPAIAQKVAIDQKAIDKAVKLALSTTEKENKQIGLQIQRAFGELQRWKDNADKVIQSVLNSINVWNQLTKGVSVNGGDLLKIEELKNNTDTNERRQNPTPASGAVRVSSAQGEAKLPPGEKAVLIACIQYPNGLRREQLTILTGYKRSSRDAYIARLKEKGFIHQQSDSILATDSGIDFLGGDYEPLPTGKALQEYWLDKLPPGEKAMLEILIAEYPNAVSRDVLSERSGYQRSSRDAYLARMGAKELLEVIGRGEVKASDSLFE